jgi:hypothetical protein
MPAASLNQCNISAHSSCLAVGKDFQTITVRLPVYLKLRLSARLSSLIFLLLPRWVKLESMYGCIMPEIFSHLSHITNA